MNEFKGQPESKRFVKALRQALTELGPVRTLDLIGDEFLRQNATEADEPNTVMVRGWTPYLKAVTHINYAMNEFTKPIGQS